MHTSLKAAKHLFQPISNALLSLLFQWGIGTHDLDPVRHLAGKGNAEEFDRKWKQFESKAAHQLFKDYVLFPLLAPWNAPRVLFGNLAANLIRNVWTNVIIFCGHFPDGTQVFTEAETADETRGDWYLRQMQGSANIEGSPWFHLMTGHLSHQIEHHLFPDIPAPRYPEIAVRVRALCEKYNLPYNSDSFWRQYGSGRDGPPKVTSSGNRQEPTRRRAGCPQPSPRRHDPHPQAGNW